MDAHKESDKILSLTEKQIKKTYQESLNQARNDISIILADMDLTAKLGTERINEIRKYNRLEKLISLITEQIARASAMVGKDVNKLGASVYQLNYDITAKRFDYKGISKTDSAERVDEVDYYGNTAKEGLKDKRVISREIQNLIISAVLTSSGTSGIFRAVKEETNRQYSASRQIAVTTTTLAENKGIFDVGKLAVKRGKKMMYTWRAVDDSKTRPTHRQASGQTVEFGKPFIVGGEKLMYPGDTSLGASAKNTINCRCMTVLVEIKEKQTS